MEQKIGRREFLRQGSLAGVLAAGALPGGALPDGEPTVAEPAGGSAAPALPADRQLDSREFTLSRYQAAGTPSLSFAAAGPAEARRWQKRLRARVAELVGGFDARRADLRPETLERVELAGYTRERVVFQTRDDLSAIGYLLLPRGRTGPLPVVVCLPGHGAGVTDIVGLEPDGRERTARGVGYAREYALQVVEQGYAAFALEQLAFGARRDEAARRKGPGENSCRPAACAALLLGDTMVGWRAWDVSRTIDYLATRPEVDASRVATLGASGGGTTALFSAALDPRVRVAVVSAYFNTFRDSIVSLSHCPDNYVPGLLRYAEMPDLAGLVAPRALFVESGVRDTIFPIHGFRAAVERAEAIYAAFGVPDRFGSETHDGGHQFHGRGAFAFLRKHL